MLPTERGCSLIGGKRNYPQVQETQILLLAPLLSLLMQVIHQPMPNSPAE